MATHSFPARQVFYPYLCQLQIFHGHLVFGGATCRYGV
jgi:hypothetical protein